MARGFLNLIFNTIVRRKFHIPLPHIIIREGDMQYILTTFIDDTKKEFLCSDINDVERKILWLYREHNNLDYSIKIKDLPLAHSYGTDTIHILCSNLANLLVSKNQDYGDAFGKSVDKFGDIAFLVRMEDKINRMNNLMQSNKEPNNESIQDTLTDIAGYCILMLKKMQERE